MELCSDHPSSDLAILASHSSKPLHGALPSLAGQDGLPEGHHYLQQRLLMVLGMKSPVSMTLMLSFCQEAQGCVHRALLSQWQEGLQARQGGGIWASGPNCEA